MNGQWHGGKGSKGRTTNHSTYASNYDKIFNKQNTMKTRLSEILKAEGIDFAFPLKIKNANGRETYYEDSAGFWVRCEYDTDGKQTSYDDSDGLHLSY